VGEHCADRLRHADVRVASLLVLVFYSILAGLPTQGMGPMISRVGIDWCSRGNHLCCRVADLNLLEPPRVARSCERACRKHASRATSYRRGRQKAVSRREIIMGLWVRQFESSPGYHGDGVLVGPAMGGGGVASSKRSYPIRERRLYLSVE